MRYLFTSSCLPGHLSPMVPMAWGRRAAGDDVLIATHRTMTAAARPTGLPVVELSWAGDFAELHRQRLGAKKQASGRGGDPKGLFAEVAEAMTTDLVRLAEAWRPDVVVWDPGTWAGHVAAAACGALSVRHLWGPDMLAKGGDLDQMGPAWEAYADHHGGTAALGQPLTLDPCPPGLGAPGAGRHRAVRNVGWSAHGTVPPWLLEEPPSARPVVTVTAGTVHWRLVEGGGEGTLDLVDALADLDVDIIITGPAGDRAPAGRARVRAVEGCPLTLLAARSSVVIHHGGAGSLLTALGAGVPQIAATTMPDHVFNARLLAASGAGLLLPAADSSATELADGVCRLLDDPAPAAAALALAAEMADLPVAASAVPDQLTPTPGGSLCAS